MQIRVGLMCGWKQSIRCLRSRTQQHQHTQCTSIVCLQYGRHVLTTKRHWNRPFVIRPIMIDYTIASNNSYWRNDLRLWDRKLPKSSKYIHLEGQTNPRDSSARSLLELSQCFCLTTYFFLIIRWCVYSHSKVGLYMWSRIGSIWLECKYLVKLEHLTEKSK